ncbi:MAG TPA: exosortase-associated EpsI family protein, partial [Verrucomicrobiae bacterium]|nr:exosortase-associated EpsI family protein [Verrucomicrobiae bacterium]
MRLSKWTTLGLALAMMGATAAALRRTSVGGALTAPGVKVGMSPIYSDTGRLITNHSVIMPKETPGWTPVALPITEVEAHTLPADTTFGRRGYLKDDFQVEATVVLMGEDRASIHRPQWCLVGAGWTIDRTETVTVPMQSPYPYLL